MKYLLAAFLVVGLVGCKDDAKKELLPMHETDFKAKNTKPLCVLDCKKSKGESEPEKK